MFTGQGHFYTFLLGKSRSIQKTTLCPVKNVAFRPKGQIFSGQRSLGKVMCLLGKVIFLLGKVIFLLGKVVCPRKNMTFVLEGHIFLGTQPPAYFIGRKEIMTFGPEGRNFTGRPPCPVKI